MEGKGIFMTGATGVMGTASMKEILRHRDEYGYRLTVLARPSDRNRKKLAPYQAMGVNVVWGDLLSHDNIAEGVRNADIVLHIGGMVSPMADRYPEKTLAVNTGAMKTICDVVLEEQKNGHEPAVVYIGSVAQYGDRNAPHHWGKAGDPIRVAKYDAYALSKALAERMLVESGVKRWVSLRQTGILHMGLLQKTDDPIMFHVPIKGVLEWVTDEDSGRLMERVCRPDVPESFWNNFYNIGGGEAFRITNYEFEQMILSSIGCPPMEKAFDARWFATRNFHGMWYEDSDSLDDILHFRKPDTPQDYFNRRKRELPWFFKLAPVAPAAIIRMWMRHVAQMSPLGTLSWRRTGDEKRIEAYFGSIGEWDSLPDWKGLDLTRPGRKGKPVEWGCEILRGREPEELDDAELREIARIRGGLYLGDNRWVCAEGHEFSGSPRLIVRGGHWCPECLRKNLG